MVRVVLTERGVMAVRADIEGILKATLDDHRLSRGEKRALKANLSDLDPSADVLARHRSQAFDLARAELGHGDDVLVLEWLEDVVKALMPEPSRSADNLAEAWFSPGERPLNRLLSFITSTRRSLDICVFTITDDRISDAIQGAHRRGVKVRVITDNDKAMDRGSDVERLDRRGVDVRVDNTDHHMHHKFAIADGMFLVTGSYNWTRSAAKYNEENIVVLDNQGLVKAFQEEFEKLWRAFG